MYYLQFDTSIIKNYFVKIVIPKYVLFTSRLGILDPRLVNDRPS